jgi:hypothetical protein
MNDKRKNMDPQAVQEIDEFIELMNSQDNITPMMLRAHLATENLLERIIIAKLPKGNSLLHNANLTYALKLEIANSLDEIQDYLIGALRQLNKARNSAAHTSTSSVTKEILEQIGRPLGKKYIEIRKETADNLEEMTQRTFGVIYGGLLGIVHRLENNE